VNDELDRVLRLVATGQLSPEDAEPLVTALTDAGLDEPSPHEPLDRTNDAAGRSVRAKESPHGRAVRVRVVEGGRSVVDLRIPMALASLAGVVIPGLDDPLTARVAQAIRDGERGTLLDTRDDHGSGVVIATE
jgi:hypothetical protein